MATIINIDNSEFDLNSLFNLQFNFDILKRLIEALARNQKGLEQKIVDMEIKLEEKEKHERRLTQHFNTNAITTNKKFKDIEFYIENIEGHEVFSKKEEITPLEEDSVTEEENIRFINENENKDKNDDFTSDIIREKIGDFEKERDKREKIHTPMEDKKKSKFDKPTRDSTYNLQLEDKKYKIIDENSLRPSSKIKSMRFDSESERERIENLTRKEKLEEENLDRKLFESESKFKNDKSYQTRKFKSTDSLDQATDPLELINHLMMRLVRIEKELSNFVPITEEFPIVKETSEKNNDLTSQNLTQIEEILKKLEILETNDVKANEKFEQINNKLADLNIFELFKNNSGEGIGEDVALKMVQAFDSKFTTKFNLIDKRLKSMEEENFKIKNESVNLKNIQETQTRTIQTLKEDLEKLFSGHDKLNEEFVVKTGVLEKNLLDVRDELMVMILQVSKEMKDYIESEKENQNLKTDENLSNQLNMTKNSNENTEIDKKLNKEIAKRIYDLEKNLKLLQHKINMDWVKSEIAKMWAAIETKISLDEFHPTKDLTNQHDVLLRFLKETVSQISEDVKIPNDYAWIRKKVESLSNVILNLKNNDDPNAMNGRDAVINSNKYLEISSFIEFQKSYNRELDGMRKDIIELKRYIEDVITAIKSKTSDKDLKNLEELLLAKLEEYKLSSIRRYADKVDTQKNFKYLDAQIKHVVEVYIKRTERGDNWLIAKKPVNGYTCASCETYIGDLNDKTGEHIPWNKYPARESNEKSYRMGNGFSRMLQMMNVDVKKSNDSNSNALKSISDAINIGEVSDDEMVRAHSNYNKQVVLPKVKVNKKDNCNMSADNVNGDESVEDNNPNRPKIVNIYKKSKAPPLQPTEEK